MYQAASTTWKKSQSFSLISIVSHEVQSSVPMEDNAELVAAAVISFLFLADCVF